MEYPVELRFGAKPAWTLKMDGVHLNRYPGLTILIDGSSSDADRFLVQFRNETMMEWHLGGRPLGRYALDGSRRAFEEVAACQKALSR
jgi:hypothetical protein